MLEQLREDLEKFYYDRAFGGLDLAAALKSRPPLRNQKKGRDRVVCQYVVS